MEEYTEEDLAIEIRNEDVIRIVRPLKLKSSRTKQIIIKQSISL